MWYCGFASKREKEPEFAVELREAGRE